MAEVGDVYPGTNEKIVGVIYNQNGPGRWLQGEFGGVFSEGGAPYLGGYFDPNMAQHRNDPNRRFTGIEAYNGGYRSISATPGEAGYGFGAPPAPVVTPPPPVLSPAQQRAAAPGAGDAKGELVNTLAQYGLPASLADQLWDVDYIQNGTPIKTIINLVLPNTTEYKQRFPGMAPLQEARNQGQPVIVPTVGEYLELEAGIAQVLSDAGLPPGLWDDPTDFAKWIGGSTSPKEVEDRIAFARTVAFSMPVETREELNRVYGIEPGELVAYVLDPDRALPEIQKRVLGAGIGGAAKKVGFGLLTPQEMEQLADSGVTMQGAGQGFGELAQMGEGLFSETAGESMTGDQLGRETQIGYVAQGGTGAAAAQMQTRRQRRAAQFQGGGGAASGGEGKTGLG